MSAQPRTTLLDPTFVRRLDQLSLVNNRRLLTAVKGERRSRARGSSLEFMDYRQYVPGDDLRQVDWNAYGRLGAMHVKLFEEEEMLTVHVLLDISKSMDWGQPNKLDYAVRLAAALGYVAMGAYDRVEVAALTDDVVSRVGPCNGPSGVGSMLHFLSHLAPAGQTSLPRALRAYGVRHRKPGMVLLISDLLSPDGWEAGVRELLQRRFDVVLLHVLAPQEVEPPVGGDLRLVDRETGHGVDVTLSQHALDRYHQRFDEWIGDITSFARKHKVPYCRVDTSMPLMDLLFKELRTRGLLQ